jgi:uncharacterized protein (DUF983 family)
MKRKARGYFATVFHQKCPRCREGHLFEGKNPYRLRKIFDMHETCPVCGQKTELEAGFYYGTAYVSYALTVAFSATTFVASWVLFGFSTEDNRIFWWMGINACLMLGLQPFFMRLSRAIWLSFFVKYNDHWQQQPLEEP